MLPFSAGTMLAQGEVFGYARLRGVGWITD